MEKRRNVSGRDLLKNTQINLLIANFKRLSLEKKGLILSHFFVFLFSFFPWVHITTMAEEFDITLFFRGNVAFFILWAIILISIFILVLFVDTLLNLNKIKIPFSRDSVYLFAGVQQLILAFLALSSLVIWGGINNGSEVSVSFGFFVSILAIIGGILATFLEIKNDKRKKAHEFFQSPGGGMKPEPKTKTEGRGPINHIDKD